MVVGPSTFSDATSTPRLLQVSSAMVSACWQAGARGDQRKENLQGSGGLNLMSLECIIHRSPCASAENGLGAKRKPNGRAQST